jgi:hypothetical protein
MAELSPEIRLYRLEDARKASDRDFDRFKTQMLAELGEIRDRQEQSQKILISLLVAVIIGIGVAVIQAQLAG